MLCQLSYTHHPMPSKSDLVRLSAPSPAARLARVYLAPFLRDVCRAGEAHVARQKGFEPLTRGLEGRCSFHLSYWRDIGATRFERATPCSQGRCATRLRHAPSH